MKNKIELLAPAGDLERLKIALLYGADAVYIGGPSFGLRANATNFTIAEIKEAAIFAHKYNKKLYVTVNIAMHNQEAHELDNYLSKLKECGIDAIIVSDPAIIPVAKKFGIEVHLSTQQSTLNHAAIKLFKDLGVSRIVMAREASREDIISIKRHVPIEIECFIHGAICASYSGRCVLSNFLTGRDSNRGGCSQICRWDFDLYNNHDEHLKGEKPFTFCTKDLSMLRVLDEMISSGVDSLKIEGRMRSIYYIATVVSIYRKTIDNYFNNNQKYTYNKRDEEILTRCANRESTVQFWNGIFDKTVQYYNGRQEVSNQDFLGVVKEFDEHNMLATIEERNYFKKGDIVEIFGPNMKTISFKINEIIDEDGNNIDVVNHPLQVVKIKVPSNVSNYSMMRIKI